VVLPDLPPNQLFQNEIDFGNALSNCCRVPRLDLVILEYVLFENLKPRCM
jgi:hypothetical protein